MQFWNDNWPMIFFGLIFLISYLGSQVTIGRTRLMQETQQRDQQIKDVMDQMGKLANRTHANAQQVISLLTEIRDHLARGQSAGSPQ